MGMGFLLITVGVIALAFTAFGAGSHVEGAAWMPFAFFGGVLRFMLGFFFVMLLFRLMAGMFFFGPMRWHRRGWGYEHGTGHGCGPRHHHHGYGPHHHERGPYHGNRHYRPHGRHGHHGERWYGGPQGWGGRPERGGWDRPPQSQPDDNPSVRDVGPDGPAGMV